MITQRGMGVLTFSQQCSWGFHYFWIWLCANGQLNLHVSRQCGALILKCQNIQEVVIHFEPCWWWHCNQLSGAYYPLMQHHITEERNHHEEESRGNMFWGWKVDKRISILGPVINFWNCTIEHYIMEFFRFRYLAPCVIPLISSGDILLYSIALHAENC